MTGVDRMKVLKTCREAVNARKAVAEKAAAELAKSPLRPPARSEPTPLYAHFGRSTAIDDDDDYDIDPEDEDEDEETENISDDANTIGERKMDKMDSSSSSQQHQSQFTIDISTINVPSSLTTKGDNSANNTGRSSRVEHEHNKKDSPKPAEDDYDYDSDEDLTPRTVARMQAAYAEMMGGGGGGRVQDE